MTAATQRWFEKIEKIIYPVDREQRFTQDSPVYADVWLEYAQVFADKKPETRVELLLTVHRDSAPAFLAAQIRDRLREDVSRRTNVVQQSLSPRVWDRLRHLATERHPAGAPREDAKLLARTSTFQLSCNESHVAVRLNLGELLRVALPLTNWWKNYAFRDPQTFDSKATRVTPERLSDRGEKSLRSAIANNIPRRRTLGERGENCDGYWMTQDLLWLVELVGTIARGPASRSKSKAADVDKFVDLLAGGVASTSLADPPTLWSVNRNRPVDHALDRSTKTAKADAATVVFRPDCSNLSWAVIDCGVDAAHIAFRKREKVGSKEKLKDAFLRTGDGKIVNQTRIRSTYDFTRLRALIDIPILDAEIVEAQGIPDDLMAGLQSGRFVDWGKLEPLLRIDYDPVNLKKSQPAKDHGTHVAGVIAGEWNQSDQPPAPAPTLDGLCPNLEIHDFRVFDDGGKGDEYSVLGALQFIRYLNSGKDQLAIHGVNLSISIKHDAANFACGRTPVCDECERLVHSGVVVVAAAGNLGYARFQTEKGERSDGCRMASITDPGNTELVITVGSTHRTQPHRYGVSYFSSRGPTADGRCKPDLVAPGEKIVAPTPGGKSRSMDGTSMAAPHVSGAAALIMARYPELIGRPDDIKKLLMASATDLGRERYFQGAGLLDILRALQAV